MHLPIATRSMNACRKVPVISRMTTPTPNRTNERIEATSHGMTNFGRCWYTARISSEDMMMSILEIVSEPMSRDMLSITLSFSSSLTAT